MRKTTIPARVFYLADGGTRLPPQDAATGGYGLVSTQSGIRMAVGGSHRTVQPRSGRPLRRSLLAAGFSLLILMATVAGELHGDDLAVPASIVVARIDGHPIYRATYTEVLRRAGYDAATTQQERQQIAAKVVEELINEQLIGQLLKENGVAVTSSEVDAMIASLRSQLSARQQTLEAFLQESGRDESMLRKQLATELGLNKLLVPRLTMERLQECFEQRKQEFDGTRLRVSHVVLRPDSAAGDGAEAALLEKAADIRREIEEGRMSFVEAVGRYSAGQSRLREGDLGFIPRHGLMHEAFAAEAFRLTTGEVSQPFLTPFGVHLVTVTDVAPGRGSLSAARGEVQKLLASELLREMLEAKRASVEIAYSAGIPHFADAVGSDRPRTVVVEPANEGSGGE